MELTENDLFDDVGVDDGPSPAPPPPDAASTASSDDDTGAAAAARRAAGLPPLASDSEAEEGDLNAELDDVAALRGSASPGGPTPSTSAMPSMPWPPRGDFDPDAARRVRGGGGGGGGFASSAARRFAGRRPGTAGVAASLPAGGAGAALMGTSLPIAIPAGMLAAAAARKKLGGGGMGGDGDDDTPVVHVGAATFVPPHLLDGGTAAPGFGRSAAARPTGAEAAALAAGILSPEAAGSPGGGGGGGAACGLKRDRLLQRNAVLRQTGFLEGAAPAGAAALATVWDPLRPGGAVDAAAGGANPPSRPLSGAPSADGATAAAAAAVAAAVAGGAAGGDGPLSPTPGGGGGGGGLRRRTSEVSEPRPAPARPGATAVPGGHPSSATPRASALSLALGTPPAGVAGSGPRPATAVLQ